MGIFRIPIKGFIQQRVLTYLVLVAVRRQEHNSFEYYGIIALKYG